MTAPLPEPCRDRGDRRRHHRLLHRLSSGPRPRRRCRRAGADKLISGSTWHAAGLVGQLRSSASITQLLQYSVELYGRLEAETGLATGWKMTGCLRLAGNADRWTEFKRLATTARSFGMDMQLLSPAEVKAMWPLMMVDDLVGASFLPSDGQASPPISPRPWPRARAGMAPCSMRGCGVTGFDIADRPGAGGPHRPRRHRLRQGGDLRRPVGPRCRGAGRRQRAAAGGEHQYRDHRADRRSSTATSRPSAIPTAAPISRRRSAASSSAATSPIRALDAILRRPIRLPAVRRRLAAFRAAHDPALARDAGARDHRHQADDQWPRKLHPRRQFHPRRGPRARNFFLGAGFNAFGIAAPAAPAGRLPDGCMKASPRSTSGSSTSAVSPAFTATRPCPRPHPRGLWPPLWHCLSP